MTDIQDELNMIDTPSKTNTCCLRQSLTAAETVENDCKRLF